MSGMLSFRRSRLKVVSGTRPAMRCPYCKDDFAPSEDALRCPACGVSSHTACWEQNRGCAVFGCRGDVWFFTHRRLTAPVRPTSFVELVSGASTWCVTILGLAFMIFLALTMTSLFTLSADSFREWVLTRSYLAGSLSLASVVVAGLLRNGLRDRVGRSGFALAFLLIILGVLYAGQIWTRAHLPY